MSSPREASTSTEQPARAGQRIVVEDLKRFGPDASFEPVGKEFAEKYCKSLAERHYENFSIASFLVPARLRQDFFNIYAYCRWSDDLADELENSSDAMRHLEWWRGELRQCFQQQAKHPVFVALKGTVARHQISPGPFEDLLDAFVQDQRIHRYETDDELISYCRGSANPVGRILLKLAGTSDSQALLWSDSICTGLQIANFCQDVRRDALRGRIYFPKQRWADHAISEADLLRGECSKPLLNAMRDWVAVARGYLIGGLPLVKVVPAWLSRDIQLFARGGLTILDNIERSGFDVWTRPIQVSKGQKVKLLMQSLLFPRSTQVAKYDLRTFGEKA